MPAPIGNQNARKENRLWSETIRRVIAQNDSAKLRKAAEALVAAAEAGDIAALKELGDRIDGKSAQQLLIGGDGSGDPVIVEVVRFADKAT